jgi:hypothetical protein
MAQRVYLFSATADALSLIEQYVTDARHRAEIAMQLAEQADVHQRVVAASERIVARVRHREEAAFLYASNCLPYFLACESSDDIVASVMELEHPRSDPELDDFFVQQAQKLGYRVGKLDHRKYAPKDRETISRAVSHYLDPVAKGYQRSIGGSGVDANAAYGMHAWTSIGMLLARLGPAWWQGRNRWLGYLANCELFGGPPVDALELQRLRQILQTTANLMPRMAVAHWGEGLFAGGSPRCTCAHVATKDLDSLLELTGLARWATFGHVVKAAFGISQVDDWRTTVESATRYALRKDRILLEGDEVFEFGYRWPPL